MNTTKNFDKKVTCSHRLKYLNMKYAELNP